MYFEENEIEYWQDFFVKFGISTDVIFTVTKVHGKKFCLVGYGYGNGAIFLTPDSDELRERLERAAQTHSYMIRGLTASG